MLGLNKQSKFYKAMNADVCEYLKRDIKSFRIKPRLSFSRLKLKPLVLKPKLQSRIQLNRTFLSVFILTILLFGFLGGSIYGRVVKNHIENVVDTLGAYFPFLSDSDSFLKDKDLVLPVFDIRQSKQEQEDEKEKYLPVITQEEAVINVVKYASPAVVNIIIMEETPVYETYYEIYKDPFEEFFGEGSGIDIKVPKQRQKGTKLEKVGSGTGFIVSEDGLVLTNKHVAQSKTAKYLVVTSEGREYPAEVLARDPFQDLAVLKIEQEARVDSLGGISKEKFPVLKLGDSSLIQIGQTVVAIGYALGEFSNTVSVGVISGKGRTITASGGGISEVLTDVLQTDAAINRGNSGGPLLNLRGEVIGINVAMAEQAQSIGFAITANKAKKATKDVKLHNKIVYAFLGVRHMQITPRLQQELDLKVDYGSLISAGDAGEVAVQPGSAADQAGLKVGDIILEVNSVKIDQENSLGDIIQENYYPGDVVVLRVLRGEQELILSATLGEVASEE